MSLQKLRSWNSKDENYEIQQKKTHFNEIRRFVKSMTSECEETGFFEAMNEESSAGTGERESQ